MGDSSVKVAVRVRPFNSRQKEEGAVLCVDMAGNMTKLFNKETGYQKEFFFDYSYWSHDGCREDPATGILYKDAASSKYADQQMVFNDLGTLVLDNAWEGYHCCLFAYGQTGAGKSYSMVGYGPNKGIIPIACDQIFKRIKASENTNIEYKVTASMLEIYNQQIQDLLTNPGNRQKGGLKVRQDAKKGFYVQGLNSQPVGSYDEINAVLEKGNKHRTVAATQMNATSSRAHTVLTISFTQIFYDEGTGKPLNRKESNINLVDLAGSERAGKTGATGDRLQEGSNINLSLSTLGKVITTLAKKSAGQLGKNTMIPYRESKLTMILANALGGNSKTTMIAAISPATFNFDETLSTLRYADAVKSIKNQAVVNETPQEKLIRELKQENEKLKQMLGGGGGGGGLSDDKRLEYEQMIEKLKREKEEAEKTQAERRSQQIANPMAHFTAQALPTSPYIQNLNQDPMLSGYIKHRFKEGPNRIGKKNPSNMPQIIVEGLGVKVDHCLISVEEGVYTITPTVPGGTMVNGQPLVSPLHLNPGDRIKFGNHNFFIFKDPRSDNAQHFDWEFAVKEANQQQVRSLLGGQDEQMKKMEEELKRKAQQEYEQARRKMEQQKKQLEALLKNREKEDTATQQALAERERELQARRQVIEEELRKKEQDMKRNQQNRISLERLKKTLTHAIQQINQANERAVLLKRNVMFQPELYRESGANRAIGSGLKDTKVRIKVIHPDLSEIIQINWSLDKLDERLIDMQELCNQLQYGADQSQIGVGYDPFTDKAQTLEDTYQLIGHAFVYLDSIYHLLSVDEDKIPIIDDRGARKGQLTIALTPSFNGLELEDYDNLRELISKQLELQVKIGQAFEIPPDFSTGVYCKYALPVMSNEEFLTEKCQQTTLNPKFNYQYVHKGLVTEQMADDFFNHALSISLYGDISQEKKQRELDKLREVAEANIGGGGNQNSFLDIDPDLGTPLSPEVSQGNTDAINQEINKKDEMIQKLRMERLAIEEEYSKKVRDLEAQIKQKEETTTVVTPKQSGCCSIF